MDKSSVGCQNQWDNALSEIQNATNGLVIGLTAMHKDPWGYPYFIDANQGEGGDCSHVDGFWVDGQTIPGTLSIPLSPSCP